MDKKKQNRSLRVYIGFEPAESPCENRLWTGKDTEFGVYFGEHDWNYASDFTFLARKIRAEASAAYARRIRLISVPSGGLKINPRSQEIYDLLNPPEEHHLRGLKEKLSKLGLKVLRT